ncbi:MAG TPA: hypothetical protein VFS12_14315 [Terriglobia bacterium]|nr:hypothetical protein [Terriglobia bacterium]
MFTLQSTIVRWLDWLFWPFKRVDPFWALLAASLVTTFIFLEVFRRTTDSTKLQEAKNNMQARLLEVRLFRDSPSIVLAALVGMLACNLRYLRHSLKPTLLMLPPLVVLMIHLDAWFGHVPLRPGQAALVRVKLLGPANRGLDDVSLEAAAGLAIETPSLRIPQEKEISWVVRATQAGQYLLSVRGAGSPAQKTIVVVDGGWDRAARRVVTAGFWNQWTHPGEASLPQDGPFEWVEVNYPDRSLALFGWKTHWLVLFFVFTCAFGFVGSKLLRVTV